MKPMSIVFVLCMVFCASQAQESVDDLLHKVVNECFHAGYSKCIKENVLSYLNTQVPQEPSSRQVDLNEVDSDSQGVDSEQSLDEKILARVRRYFLSHQFVIESPEYMRDAAIVYNPAKNPADFDVVYKNEQSGEQARSFTARQEQDKALMPLIMMLKMKVKMLTPILMLIIGMKAAKAYVLSKLSILIVLGFVIMQTLSKKGMMPMNMMAMPMPMAGAESATPPSSYGVSTTSSYDPAANWEANSGGPYSRVWDSAHNQAYSSYSSYKPSYSSYSTSGSSGVGVAATYQSSTY